MEPMHINHIGPGLEGFEHFDYSVGSYVRSFYISPQEYELKKLNSYRPPTESNTGVDSRVAEILSYQYRAGLPISDLYNNI